MSDRVDAIRARIAALREAFDASLVAPIAPPDPADRHELVVLAVGGREVAAPVGALRSLRPIDGLVPVIGARPALLGLLGADGGVFAVHDLARLLELPEAEPRWVAVLDGADGAALAVAEVRGQVRVAVSPRSEDEARRYAGRIAEGGHAGCPVLDVVALRAEMEA